MASKAHNLKVIAASSLTSGAASPMAEPYRKIIEHIGEDVTREGLLKTPERAAKAMMDLTSGYTEDINKLVNDALFESEVDEMVVVKGIEYYSLCEHHLLPFYGRVHVAYLPDKHIIGLSKIPRIVDVFARRLQVQERMTSQIAQTINDVLKPRGVAVMAEGKHFCMMMRGVEKQCSDTVSSAMLGAFRKDKSTRDEFLSIVRHQSHNY
jgi:GTP cyclohydrolase IA